MKITHYDSAICAENVVMATPARAQTPLIDVSFTERTLVGSDLAALTAACAPGGSVGTSAVENALTAFMLHNPTPSESIDKTGLVAAAHMQPNNNKIFARID